jgi:iron complex transport system permease protein
MKKRAERFRLIEYAVFAAVTVVTAIVCVCLGSVSVPISETVSAIFGAVTGAFTGSAPPETMHASVILAVRLPRVLAVALTGASLSLCGAAVQGLLRNPLADASNLGVSSGAAVGAALSIAFGFSIPGFFQAGTMVSAMVFAFISLVLILTLSYRLDYSLSTNTIILIGLIFTMFASSITSLIVTFAGHKVNSIIFWMMGSLSGAKYRDVVVLAGSLVLFGAVIFYYARELNAFAIGEENARNVGVNVGRVKYAVLIAVSALVGVCVSIGGSIGFVGLVIPHMTRMIVGPNHRRLLPAVTFSGAVFLMLADLAARTVLSPRELPIGVVTSFVGAFAFVLIFYQTRKGR